MTYHYKYENGTIRCDETSALEAEEKPVDDFLQTLDIFSRGYVWDFDFNKGFFKVDKTAVITALGNDEYRIKYYDLFNDDYRLNIKNTGGYYSILKGKLDELDLRCAPFRHAKEVIDCLERNPNDKQVTEEDLNIYIKYLEKYFKRERFLSIFFITTFLASPLVTAWAGLYGAESSGLTQGLSYILAAGSFCYLGISLALTKSKSFDPRNHQRIKNIIKQKIAFAKKRLQGMTKTISSENDVKTNSDNKSESQKYTDNILNIMSGSLDGIVKLNREDKINKLLELRELLVSYKLAMKGKMDGNTGLTLDSSEYSTLCNLNDIDLAVSSIAKNDQKLAECDDLMTRISDYLNVVDGNQRDIASKAPSRKKNKVATSTN